MILGMLTAYRLKVVCSRKIVYNGPPGEDELDGCRVEMILDIG